MALTKITGAGTGSLDSLTTTGALDVTTSTHANASVFKSTGHTQVMLQDTDATANDQFWGLKVSGGAFNILTCNDDMASGFLTPITIDSSGNVGLGQGTPTQRLHVDEPTSNNQACIINSSLSSFQGQVLKLTSVRTTTNSSFNFFLCGTDKLAIRDSGNVVNTNNSYGQFSDQRLKENIKDASSQWDDIKALQVRNFNFIDDDLTQIGVVAQEVETAGMSGLVEESRMSEPDEDGNDVVRKNVKYSVLYMKAVKALQEAMTRIETLETKVAALEGS